MYALQWLAEQMRQSSAQDLDQHALTDGFGFDRFVRATLLVTAILFRDDRQAIIRDFFIFSRPVQRCTGGVSMMFSPAKAHGYKVCGL